MSMPVTAAAAPQKLDLTKVQSCLKGVSDKHVYDFCVMVIGDASFVSDPKSYMERWKERRGYTEEYRYPADLAQGIMGKIARECLCSATAEAAPEQTPVDLGHAFLNLLSDTRVAAYCRNILNNPDFINDPQSYMVRWQERRGYTEEYRFPEDSAQSIMWQITRNCFGIGINW